MTPSYPLTYLINAFTKWASSACVVSGTALWKYADLLQEIERDRDQLRSRRIGPGHVVIVTGNFVLRHISLFFAIGLEGGGIVPLLGPAEEIHKCGDIANATHVISIASDGSWALAATSRAVTNPLLTRLFARGEAGLIVFTSGSSGEKKAILHSLPKMLRRFLKPRRTYRALMFSSIDHLGGLNTILYLLSNGGLIAVPSTQRVDEACSLIQEHRIQLLPTTPSFLNLLLLSGNYRRYDLSSLELITYGSELMPATTLERLRAVFPSVTLQQTYGLSELGQVRLRQMDAGSLAVKIVGEGVETKVHEGTLWIRSESAMEGYLNYDDGMTNDGWFDTGDLVEVNGDFITFLGRKSSIINVAGQKVYPGEVESFLLAQRNVTEVVVSGEPNAFVGRIVVAHVVRCTSEPEQELIDRLKAACRKTLPRFMVPAKIYVVSKFGYSRQHKKRLFQMNRVTQPARGAEIPEHEGAELTR